MICKKTNGSGFRGLAQYLLRDGRGDIVAGVMAGRTPRELATEFGKLRHLNPSMNKAVMHFSISPAPEDPPFTDAQWQSVAHRFVTALGYQDAPWVAVMHRDDPHHVHMHLMTCRIDLHGRTVSNFNDFRKAEKLMRTLETEMGLRRVKGPETKAKSTINNQGDNMHQQSNPEPAKKRAQCGKATVSTTLNRFSSPNPLTQAPAGNGASTDVPDKTARAYRRHMLEPGFEQQMRDLLGDSLTRVFKHRDGVTLYFRDPGHIQDLGSRLLVIGAMDEQLAASRIVAMGVHRRWSTISFTGSPTFVEHAMRAALDADLEVFANGAEQLAILSRVIAERDGRVGSAAALAFVPNTTTTRDEHPTDSESRSDLAQLEQLRRDLLPSLQEQADAPHQVKTPTAPVVGVLPHMGNFKERLQAHRSRQASPKPADHAQLPQRQPRLGQR